MRDYPISKTKYVLPSAVYHLTVWQIRDYHRLKEYYDDVLTQSPRSADGQPRGGGCSDTTMAKAIKRANAKRVIDIIDSAKRRMPAEYAKGVWDNIVYGQSYPLDASRATYTRYKAKFIYDVANKLVFGI